MPVPADRLLLDTHVFLWWRADDRRLNAAARDAIATADLIFVSAASAWEAAIKQAIGRLDLPESIAVGVAASGFEKLPITFAHAETAASLPPHHADPFDRMLVAQCLTEGLTLVTRDRKLAPYGPAILWT